MAAAIILTDQTPSMMAFGDLNDKMDPLRLINDDGARPEKETESKL